MGFFDPPDHELKLKQEQERARRRERELRIKKLFAEAVVVEDKEEKLQRFNYGNDPHEEKTTQQSPHSLKITKAIQEAINEGSVEKLKKYLAPDLLKLQRSYRRDSYQRNWDWQQTRYSVPAAYWVKWYTKKKIYDELWSRYSVTAMTENKKLIRELKESIAKNPPNKAELVKEKERLDRVLKNFNEIKKDYEPAELMREELEGYIRKVRLQKLGGFLAALHKGYFPFTDDFPYGEFSFKDRALTDAQRFSLKDDIGKKLWGLFVDKSLVDYQNQNAVISNNQTSKPAPEVEMKSMSPVTTQRDRRLFKWMTGFQNIVDRNLSEQKRDLGEVLLSLEIERSRCLLQQQEQADASAAYEQAKAKEVKGYGTALQLLLETKKIPGQEDVLAIVSQNKANLPSLLAQALAKYAESKDEAEQERRWYVVTFVMSCGALPYSEQKEEHSDHYASLINEKNCPDQAKRWQLLVYALERIVPSTTVVDKIRRALLDYCLLSKTQAEAIFSSYRYDPAIKNQRYKDVVDFIGLLTQPNIPISAIIERIKVKSKELKDAYKYTGRGTTLYKELEQIAEMVSTETLMCYSAIEKDELPQAGKKQASSLGTEEKTAAFLMPPRSDTSDTTLRL